MSFGNQAFVRVARQASAGAPASATTSFFSVPFISETMVTNIPPLVSDTIRARYEEGPVSQGIVSPAGDINFRLHPIVLGAFLYAVHGQESAAAVGSGFQHTFIPVTTTFYSDIHLNPYTIEVYKGADLSYFYQDAVADKMTLDITGGQFGRGSVSWICRTTSTASASTPAFPGGDEFTWNQASVSLGGSGVTIFDNISFTINNAMTAIPALDGTKSPRRIQRNGFRTMTINGTVDFPDNTEYNKFRAGSAQALRVTLTSPVVVNSAGLCETLDIQVPTMWYDSFPVSVPGPNRITVAFVGRAKYNVGSALAWQITLVNTQAQY